MSPPKRTNEKDSPAAPAEAGIIPTPTPAATSPSGKQPEADRLIRQYIGWSCAGGLLPVPLLDIAAITAAQLQMVRELSTLYGVPFQDHLGRNLVASLVGGVGSAAAGRGIFCSVLKAVPVVGAIGGLISVPIVAGSATYALGQVFVEHFERGGTLLDFDPKPARAFFEEKLKEGQKVAKDVWTKVSARS
jgi:uncharacterized protein (DUF697 family)